MQRNEDTNPVPPAGRQKNVRTGMSVEEITQSVLDNLFLDLGKLPHSATRNDWYLALAGAVRDRMMRRWTRTIRSFGEDLTVVACLSAEFLPGPQLGINLINLGMCDEVNKAVKELGLNLQDLAEQEEDPGLGNGGLGRLASCYMDSLSTLRIPAIGYGVRYEFGNFRQEIQEGMQVETTNKWLQAGNPWEVPHPEINYNVKLGGHTESYYDEQNCFRVRWIPKFSIKGLACDTPVTGYGSPVINLLRLWKCESVESFDFEAFNTGDYFSSLNEKIASESIGKILYPDDEPYAGKQLRLAQQYFFVSCALQDMIRQHLLRWQNIHTFSNSFSVQLNDSHPAIAVAELMRLLVDEHLVNWDKAWYITQNTFSYTNQTILPEALLKWPLPLLGDILPRHLEIVYEINRRFVDEIWLTCPNNNDKLSRLSLIDESDQKYVRMAHLAGLGSHIINSVSETHSEALRKTLLPDLCELYPERFFNVTNGVSPRRWLALGNPRLTELISHTIGETWVGRFEDIRQLEAYANEPALIEKWRAVKYENKNDLARTIFDRTGVSVSPDTLFDIQLKRIHEYKRQHLNVLHIITLYNRIKKDPKTEITPRTFIFGGKASPGYFIANLVIKLINSVAGIVNNDPDVAGRIKVVFFPDFSVKNGLKIYPAADLSEQISISGREVCGTGGMKFAMNGALTIGTPDGANAEIRAEVGKDNFFLFGLTAEEVSSLKSRGYDPMGYYSADQELKEAIDLISSGFFYPKDATLFKPLVDSLLRRDEHLTLADYRAYNSCQDLISMAYRDQKKWTKMSILNVARMGKFSSDRAIREYCEKIWHAKPLEIDAEDE
jgi:glycogen phosphorylase